MRKLASIQKIATITAIEGADRIELATMEGLDWECVIPKADNFKVGDGVVYFEVDSILPEKDEFEFLRDVKFRIKIRKFRKQISQGLIASIKCLPLDTKCKLGADVTELLGVTKYDVQLQEERALRSKTPKSPLMKFLMKNKQFRTIYLKINAKPKSGWPEWISKTDEERIQNCGKIIMDHWSEGFYITEKLDGQSATFFGHKTRRWGMSRLQFGVCSRNIWLKTPNTSSYWKIAKQHDLEKKLKKMNNEIVIQGEIIGPSVQGNKYKVTELQFHVFNVVCNGVRLGLSSALDMCEQLGLTHVPVLNTGFCPAIDLADCAENRLEVVKKMVDMSMGKGVLCPQAIREGMVVRLKSNPKVSLKVINPKFLLKHDS
tara:strand:+ start:4208 stop:5329 length:1122 start_codon:yes stop_codon:yes gene_type:complete